MNPQHIIKILLTTNRQLKNTHQLNNLNNKNVQPKGLRFANLLEVSQFYSEFLYQSVSTSQAKDNFIRLRRAMSIINSSFFEALIRDDWNANLFFYLIYQIFSRLQKTCCSWVLQSDLTYIAKKFHKHRVQKYHRLWRNLRCIN